MADGDRAKRQALSLPDQAWRLWYIIQQWQPPTDGATGSPVWMDHQMIDELQQIKKTLDVMAFYGADDFVRREAKKKKKA